MSEEEAGYGIGAVSRLLGVPAPTLRTWNLRYGLGPSRRSAGGHRRYDTADLHRLREMKRLIAEGLPPAEAARHALTLTSEAPREQAEAAPPATRRPPAEPGPAGAGVASLVRAAFVLDSHAVTHLLEASLAAHGVRPTWERLVLPAFDAVCRRQDDSGAGIDVEHLLSDRILAALHRHTVRHTVRQAAPAGRRPVLLACAEDEQHTLPVHALSAALAEEGVETRVLGARTPYAALAHAMRRLHPAAVFVWSQQEITGATAPLAALPRLRPAARLIVGGRGWRGALPEGVIRVDTFREALSQVRATLP